MKYIVSFKENGERLDKAVALLNNNLSRSFITKLLKDGKILVNGNVEKPSFKVKENDEIFVEEIEDTKANIKEEDIPAMAAHADHEANPLYPCPALFDKKELIELLEEIRG